MASQRSKLRDVISLDSELNKLQDLDILLERILTEARRVTSADGGSIYIRRGEQLDINYSQNDTKQAELPKGEKLIYKVFSFPINKKSIAGYAAATGEPINISDVYKIPDDAPYGFNKNVDKASGYRSKSMLVIPLRTNMGEILGVIQLINKKTAKGNITYFNKDDELVLMHFATNATVALQRAQMTRAILLRMIRMAELRDPTETGPHVNRVAGYAIEIYERWAYDRGYTKEQIEKTKDTLRMAAMLHDVGKVAISDVILKKPGRFTDDEFRIMKAHTLYGARLFIDKQSEFDEVAQLVALSHHENWDGTGYPGHVDLESGQAAATDANENPKGKEGEEIPLFGRIVSVCDVYDALSSKRVYKEAWTEEQVLEEMQASAGSKFDPEIIDVFFKVLPNIKTIAAKYQEPEHN
ncbi:MAG: HD domain-containing protein [Spirochaetes bacterium]|jgi:HD-GYP domain-containing protein (c-di-GMP phosphodiesterase class II)|nr:HD domain-containing protein [Spirochaetota bacterium]